jgi:hypothetical protein
VETFKSLHGEPETKGNIAQLCAIKYNPEKYMDMILCMNKDARAIPDNWESCANSNDLDVANIKTCYEGQEGIDLLKTNVPKAVEANARGSPTIFLNGNPYNSGRDTTAFLKAICAQLDGHPECINLPKCSADTDCIAEADKNGVCENPGEKDAKCTYTDPVAVAVKFLVDDNCVACQPEQVNDVTKNFFKGADFNEVKFESNEGQAMMEKYNIVYLPAYVFESEIENTLMWKTQPGLANSFIKNDDGSYRLNPEAVGSTWDPYQEVCDNEIDDNDDGKTDCEDEKCGGTMACMEKLEVPKVEMFVMSHCPFGTQFEKGAVPALKLLGDKIDYDMNFVYYAMHGKIELDEQLIQHCIQQEQKDIYLDYLECFLIDGNTDRCLSVVDIEKSDIQSCIDSTDEEFKITEQFNDKSTWLSGNYPLFDVSKDLNTKYNVGGSPSWVVNGVNIDSVGRDPASILKAICYGFDEKPAECDEVLPAVTYGSGFGPSDENVPAAPASTSGSCG